MKKKNKKEKTGVNPVFLEWIQNKDNISKFWEQYGETEETLNEGARILQKELNFSFISSSAGNEQ